MLPRIGLLFSLLGLPIATYANTSQSDNYFNLHLPGDILSIAALVVFIIAYTFVMTEEFTHLRKSKPVVVAAGIIWVIVAWHARHFENHHLIEDAVRHNILEFAEIFMFLLVAMTYVNAMEDRLVFAALRSWLVRKRFTLRQLFWVTGILTFFISPVADNLTTALIMCAVVMSVGKDNKAFVAVACVNIVVAANSGGVFSPFGDITTLMVWQKEHVTFSQFFYIFVPAVVSYLLPAAFMSRAITNDAPQTGEAVIRLRLGAKRVIALFVLTLIITICLHHYLYLPPMLGMMTGLGLLMFFAFYMSIREEKLLSEDNDGVDPPAIKRPFDIFNKIERAEWDTLFFFYGVILSVGGLATLGYLETVSNAMYTELGRSFSSIHAATPANILVGLLSAVIDNIPVMFAVLTMEPNMSLGQWLLVTLTAGIGGSLLSVGSAAGVALMGQARGTYTFMTHLKWTPAIALGYIAAIVAHLWLNQGLL